MQYWGYKLDRVSEAEANTRYEEFKAALVGFPGGVLKTDLNETLNGYIMWVRVGKGKIGRKREAFLRNLFPEPTYVRRPQPVRAPTKRVKFPNFGTKLYSSPQPK